MHDDSLSGAAGLPAALSAFLRGAERRAFVFLWLQGGDAVAAERALAAAIRAFPGPAAAIPMVEWPGRFWKLLVALPGQAGGGAWPAGLEALATMPLPVRRALLLRQVAGLGEAEAAATLGVEPRAYEALVAQACPRDAEGAPDVAGWRAQAEAIQQASRGLEAAQLLRLAQLREAALLARPVLAPARGTAAAGSGVKSAPATAARAAIAWKRWLPALLATLLVLGAVVATWWLSSRPATPVTPAATGLEPAAEPDDFRVHDNAPVVVESLPPADPPTPAESQWPVPVAEAALVDPVVAEVALLSWYAAGAPASAIDRAGKPALALPPDAVAAVVDAAGATADWSQLDATEQARLRQAAAMLAAEDAQVQATLRARFAALDAMERGGWRLGPALGADYPTLQPLIGFVDGEERAPLLAALRALSPEQRALLGDLALRTPPTARAALRHELLAQSPEQRGVWLVERSQR